MSEWMERLAAAIEDETGMDMFQIFQLIDCGMITDDEGVVIAKATAYFDEMIRKVEDGLRA